MANSGKALSTLHCPAALCKLPVVAEVFCSTLVTPVGKRQIYSLTPSFQNLVHLPSDSVPLDVDRGSPGRVNVLSALETGPEV